MIHFPHFASGTSPEQLQGAKMRLEYQARAVEHVWYLKMVSVPQVWTVSIGTWLFSTFFNQPFLGYSMLKQHTPPLKLQFFARLRMLHFETPSEMSAQDNPSLHRKQEDDI
jgi:hypothetical protein